MQEVILNKLSWIESEYGMRILYACESGSRAWGFPSPDSDYDVRFIYAHDLDWYLSLQDHKDTIDLPISDLLDMGGWEVKKALNLLRKSNAPLLEWIQSPIVYRLNEKFRSEMLDLSQSFFSPIAVMHHYHSMSKKYFELCKGEEVKLKHLMYALRTTLAGIWIREKGTMPPIEIVDMFSVVPDVLNENVEVLIQLKAFKDESYLHRGAPLLIDYLQVEISCNESVVSELTGAKGDSQRLNDLFRKVVKGEI